MTKFEDEKLSKLKNPELLLAVARETHELALELAEEGKLPSYYFTREIYEPGRAVELPNGDVYHEISHYSDGFGSSLFILGDEMLFISSDHELAPLDAIDGDRDLYLTPLLTGLPRRWDFVVDMLQTDSRFEWNPPVSVFWFRDGEWNITDDYSSIQSARPGERLYEYQGSVDYVSTTELAFLFEHADIDSPNREIIIESSLADWMPQK